MAENRTWEFTHFHAGPIESGDYAVLFLVGKRSDGLVFVEKRSLATGGCPLRYGYSEESRALTADMNLQMDGYLHPDCTCSLPKTNAPMGFVTPRSECQHHISLKLEGGVHSSVAPPDDR